MQKTRLGPFVLEENLAPGRDGSVYRAIHLQQRRAVAIRLLPHAADEPPADEFRREVEFLKTLLHPHLLQSFGGGIHQGDRYLVMELLPGDSLADVLAGGGKLPWQTAVEAMLHVCAGLEFAHQRNVFHLALSPGKLLLTEDGQVRIADFRRARPKRAGTKRLTAADVTAEEAAYLSPEQIRGRGGVSHKSDLYALGCVLFELLTGRPPFTNASVDELLAAHLRAEPPRVSSLVFDCPVWLDALVDQLLQKLPANRPAFASAVAVALQETKDRMASGASVAEQAVTGASGIKVAAEPEARGLLGRKKRKRRAHAPFYERAWFLAACILLLLGGGAWALWPASEAELFTQADALMQSDEPADWSRARTRYLEPLLERFPNGEYSARAHAHLDTIEMAQAQRRLTTNLRHGLEPVGEGERLYRDALRYEQFGDRLSALDRYQALVQLLQETPEELPYVKLARRQIAQLTQDGGESESRAEFIAARLARADELEAEGKLLDARALRESVIALYGGNRELAPLVAEAAAARDAAKENASSAAAEETAAERIAEENEEADAVANGGAEVEATAADAAQAARENNALEQRERPALRNE